ncbi:hypothetical protein BDA96_03G131600 [Sorghum bicolor]|uniref:Uncharacterized protein n=1 Tax=Sorghum bicolor TaxID=4558 RepID=A0A921RBP9_SORBI|nr:hypothetical protein BDA96_03G131600 [Sorghum bicolor]
MAALVKCFEIGRLGADRVLRNGKHFDWQGKPCLPIYHLLHSFGPMFTAYQFRLCQMKTPNFMSVLDMSLLPSPYANLMYTFSVLSNK